MKKNYDFAIREFVRLSDIVTIFAAFYIAYTIRASEEFAPFVMKHFGAYITRPISSNFGENEVEKILWFIVPLWLFLYSFFNTYSFDRTGTFFKIFRNLATVHLIGALAVATFIFSTNAWEYRRSFYIFFVLFSFVLSGSVRFIVLMGMRIFRAHGRNTNRAIIIGSGQKAFRILSELKSHAYWGFMLEGLVTEKRMSESTILGQKVLGSMDDLEIILRKMPIDDVFLATEEGKFLELKGLLRICENIGVNVYLIPDKYDLEIAHSTVGNFGDLDYISFSTIQTNIAQKGAKRVIDLILSLMLMPVFLISYIVVGIIIKLDSKGPILYRSQRVTKSRRPFTFYKFRTMEAGAEEKFHLVSRENQMEGPISKIKDDPRVTKVGKMLRKYSIDEIPQILNVFMGDMSLVGPRPPTAEEVAHYSVPQLRKLSMQQGMTGLWQVNGRDKIVRFEDRLKLDLEYIDNWSLWLDIKIILKTPFVIIKGAM